VRATAGGGLNGNVVWAGQALGEDSEAALRMDGHPHARSTIALPVQDGSTALGDVATGWVAPAR